MPLLKEASRFCPMIFLQFPISSSIGNIGHSLCSLGQFQQKYGQSQYTVKFIKFLIAFYCYYLS